MEKGSASGVQDSLNGLNFSKKIYFEDVGSRVQAKTRGRLSPVVAPRLPPPLLAKKEMGGDGGVPAMQNWVVTDLLSPLPSQNHVFRASECKAKNKENSKN
ncbi:hypothetical protein Fot_42500 [Forsythia ovata]|uniref:Uncharacterized protein n=1 Tax=Forsythia ovata TaxID=205694 RepID=A0ABD1RLD3_9LAMI